MGANPTNSLTLKSDNCILESSKNENYNANYPKINNIYQNNTNEIENYSFFQNDYLRRSLMNNSMNNRNNYYNDNKYNNNNIYNNIYKKNNSVFNNNNIYKYNKLKKNYNDKNNYLPDTTQNNPSEDSFIKENNYSIRKKKRILTKKKKRMLLLKK